MTLVALPGDGVWVPTMPYGPLTGSQVLGNSDACLLDADEEEAQFISTVTIQGGGSKTFGTSGSTIQWLPGSSITFSTDSQLRVGVKKASSIDTANGPPMRATAGGAAFDVYKELVGGTDTITSTTWRTDTMATGTPFTVADGDMLAVCFWLNSTAGTPVVKVRCSSNASNFLANFPSVTLVTASGGTFNGQALIPNLVLTFDDGTLGWLTSSSIFVVNNVNSANIGNTNIYGNIINLPWTVSIDALGAAVNASTSGANFALELYSTPLGTPALVESIAFDANVLGAASGSNRFAMKRLVTARTLTASTDYAIGVQQTTATAANVLQYDVDAAPHLVINGLDSGCYAANSTAGATFAQQNSGKRRYAVWARINAIDIPAGGGLLRHPGMQGGCAA